MKVLVCVACVPMRVVSDSVATPVLPISILFAVDAKECARAVSRIIRAGLIARERPSAGGGVVGARSIVHKGSTSDRRVVVSRLIAAERTAPDCRVARTSSIAFKSVITIRHIILTCCIGKERSITSSDVVVATCIIFERRHADCSIDAAGAIGKQGGRTGSGVIVTAPVGGECVRSNGSVLDAAGVVI